jgi:parallel beta-helix repeat protein
MKETVLTSFTISCLLSTVFLMVLSFNIQTAKAESTKLYLNPSIVYTQVGETFIVDIAVADVEDLYSWQVNMSFNADALSIVNVTEGDFLKGQPEGTFFIIGRMEESWALFACSTIGQYPGVTGSGTLAMLEFEAISEGESVLDINTEGTSMQKLNPPPSDPPLEDIPFTALDGIVYIYTPRTWTVDDDAPADFSSIKEAINSPQVMDGDTIYVYNGTYCESVVVDKTVLLIGESKNAIIDGGISIEADSVTIRDFTIQGMGVVVGTFFEPTINATIRENTLVNGGISIQNRPVPSPVFGNHTIEENTVINASVGIRMLGSVGNKIIGNTLRDNDAGIVLEQDADNNTALDNQVEGCGVGMHISSFNNTLSGNDMNDNVYNLGFHQHGAYPNAIDTSNTINGRPVYFVVDQSNILVDPISYPSPGYLALIDCANVTVKDFILSGNGQGILLQGGEDNTLVNNTLVENVVGLQVLSSVRNELANNTMSDNGIGMWLVRSSLNTIANNDLGNNSRSILNDLPQARVIYESLRLDFGWASGALILKWDSSSNLIVGNNMTDSDIGMFFPYPSINNTLRNNTMTNNLLNFGIEITQYFSSYIHDIDDSNTVNGKPIIYWVNEHEKQVPEDAGYVAVINSSDITIKNLDISNNMPGILIVSSSNSLISGNNIADCPSGIIIKETVDAIPPTQSYPSTNITVHNNTAVGCGVGISLYVGGEGHTVSQNDFSGNLAGIYVNSAEHNLISGNLVTNCTYWGYDKVTRCGGGIRPFHLWAV